MTHPVLCCIHIYGENEDAVTKLTEKTQAKIYSCAYKWVELDGNEKEVSVHIVDALSSNNGNLPGNNGYHRSCYQRFTDKRRIEIAERRVNKRKSNEDVQGAPKRLCRSETNCTGILQGSKGEERLFPPRCIICRCVKNLTVPSSCVRTQEKLVKCQTFEAETILKHTAVAKGDTGLRLLIEGEDLIAREAMYHGRCYRNYTYAYTKVEKVEDKCYEKFCKDVIEERIINGGEILSMNKLRELYLHICSFCDNVEEKKTRNKDLKRKLKRSHPDLMFLRVSNLSWSELVLQQQPIGNLTLEIDSDSDESDGEDQSDSAIQDDSVEGSETMEEVEKKRHLFHSASLLKDAVKTTQRIQCPWPPIASDLTMDSVAQIVPKDLFNFLAHVVGFNTELPDSGEFLEVAEDQKKKLFSVCQDIIYLASKGLNPMPKHLALGLTVRHLTGSSKMISILNGLGHCVSTTSVADYDSAIAMLHERDANAIPPGITQQFTTLVFDNNDFGEETMTGKGTTHVTNGIVVQRSPTREVIKEQSTTRQPVPKARGCRPEVNEQHFEKVSLPKRQGPPTSFSKVLLEKTSGEVLSENKNIEVAYIISKLPEDSTQCLPGWSGFNTILYDEIPNRSVIGYLPVIGGSPTRMEVVNEILKKCISVADRLNQETVVLVVDQAIYCKAQQIRWVNGVFTGHHYNRSVRVMKVLYEAFYRLLMESFLQSLPEEKTNSLTKKASLLKESFSNGTFFEVIQSEEFQDPVKELKQFCAVRSSESPTFHFWMTFLEMVECLLLFIRATRTGNWRLHLAAVRQMLQWFFAYDRINYARYLTVYWLEMLNLEETHPMVHSQFADGNFVVQQQTEHGFSQTAMDQTIEQTLNRDSKTKGGMTGITLKKNAVNCWILSFAERAKIQECCEEMANRQQKRRGRKELDQTRIQRDEDDVQSVVSTIKAMTNPFTTQDEELLNLASRKVAPKDVRLDLERAEKLGESELENYIDQRMQKKEVDMFSPLKAQKLKTFSATGKVKGKEEVASLKASSQLMTRMLFLAKIKNLDMADVLAYSLSPVPPSLGNYDGDLARTSKATFLNHLLEEENCLKETSPGAIRIIDGMAYLKQLMCIPPTFGKLAELILQGLLRLARKHQSRRIDFVTDRYWQLSIKNSERDRRGNGQTQVTRINHHDQKIPSNFRKFLSCGQNKEALVAFLYKHWQECSTDLYSNETVYLAHGEDCHAFSSNGVEKIDALSTDQEEADTRLMLHTAHALGECEHAVIQTPDTDVFLLAVALNEKLDGEVELSMGTTSKQKNVSISSVCEALPSTAPAALLGFHTFTGCDTTSAFKGKGKIKAYKLMLEKPMYQNAFTAIGQCWSTENVPWNDLEAFVCELYGQGSAATLVEARTKIFKSCYKTDSSLPPTRDELLQHIKRANYQAAILKRALEQAMETPTPCNHGWCLDEGQLENLLVHQTSCTRCIAKGGLL